MSEASDLLERFLAECTVDSPGDRVQATTLRQAHEAWARSRGQQPLTLRPFAREMKRIQRRNIKSSNHWWVDLKLVGHADGWNEPCIEALEAAWRLTPPAAALLFLLGKLRALGLKQ